MKQPNSQPQPSSSRWDDEDAPNSILPAANTSEALRISNQTFQMGSTSNEKLTGEQIDWLTERLSIDDQQEISKILSNCTKEMNLARGLPFAALITGAMYVVRTRLPENLQFGPKHWSFHAVIAVGALATASLLSVNNCGQRIKPKMFELYRKYTANQPNEKTTYESLTAANRQHYGQPYGTISPSSQLGKQEPQPYDQEKRPIKKPSENEPRKKATHGGGG